VSIAGSIFLIAVGAIIRYAFTFEIEGVDREVLGLILMIAGIVALAISLTWMFVWSSSSRRQAAAPDERYYSGPDDPTRPMR
jgi:hypothetical protein